MSRGITLTVLAGLVLTACVTTGGCGRRSRDTTWYDKSGNRIEQKWKTEADGKRVPDPHPYDSHGRPWVYDANGELVPQEPPAGSRSHRSGGGLFLWGGSGYRSFGSGGGSSASPSRSSSSPSSISRGGFGSTGSSSGS